MTSHGVARTAKFRTEQQRLQDLEKIRKYRSLEDELRQQVADGKYNPDTFQLTSKILRINPEYYTAWNVRRRCLISGLLYRPWDGSWPSKELPNSSASAIHTPSSADSLPSSSTVTPQAPDSQTAGTTGTTPDGSNGAENPPAHSLDAETIQSELTFTVPLLLEFPKCYWIWNYRLWILDEATKRLEVGTARKVWEQELGLVGKMLQRDMRNFHAWTYRRFVVDQLESPALAGHSLAQPEFDYTTKMINLNLSNFSAWHNRGRLIPIILSERNSDHTTRRAFFDSELALVRDGLNVGPEDQSLWYYHQYLVSSLLEDRQNASIVPDLTVEERQEYIQHEIADVRDLLEDYTDIKWIYEALIEYTRDICKLGKRELDDSEAAETAQWLGRLKELDPKRRGRWDDLGRELGLTSS